MAFVQLHSALDTSTEELDEILAANPVLLDLNTTFCQILTGDSYCTK